MSMLQLDERTQKQIALEHQQRMAQIQNGFHLMKENQARLERFRGVELQLAKLGVLEQIAESLVVVQEGVALFTGCIQDGDGDVRTAIKVMSVGGY